MSKINLTISLIVIMVIQSCNAQTKSSQTAVINVVTTKTISIVKTDTVIAVPVIIETVNPIADVYSSYIGLKNWLTKDNGDSAAAYSKKLFASINDLKTGSLSTTQNSIWIKYKDKLSYAAEHIKETKDLEHQREHFVSLSKNMYEVVKAFNTNSDAIYYQYCPMANEGKGAYWISENSKIINPYFGGKMLSCGSTKGTISPVK